MSRKIPTDIENAVNEHPDVPLKLQGESGAEFFVARSDHWDEIVANNTRKALLEAELAIKNGEVEHWDIEKIKRRGRISSNEQGIE